MTMFTKYGDSKNTTHTGSYNKNNKKDISVCTHCGMLGHIADKCYKLHGYPPGYKTKAKGQVSQGSMAHRVSSIQSSKVSTTPTDFPSIQITPATCQKLLTYLHTQMRSQLEIKNSNGQLA